MTNREWLNQMSNEDLTKFLLNSYSIPRRTNLPNGFVLIDYNYGLNDVIRSGTSSFAALMQWLDEPCTLCCETCEELVDMEEIDGHQTQCFYCEVYNKCKLEENKTK